MKTYTFSGYKLDEEAHCLTFGDSPVKLTHKALALLTLLAERAPHAVSRAEIEAAIWPDGFVEPSNVTQTVYMVRRAVAKCSGPPIIETVVGQGYRISAEVREAKVRDAREGRSDNPNARTGADTGPLRIVRNWLRAVTSALLVGAVLATIADSRVDSNAAVAARRVPISARAFWQPAEAAEASRDAANPLRLLP